MEDPPARKPTQAERLKALRRQARAGDPVAQAQVDELNAYNRAAHAKARAAGRSYSTAAAVAARQAKKLAAAASGQVLPTAAEKLKARQRRYKQALTEQRRAAGAARPPKPGLSAAELAAKAEHKKARAAAHYLALKQGVAAGDPVAVARYQKALAQGRQRRAAKLVRLTPEQRKEAARQGALKRWGKRADLSE